MKELDDLILNDPIFGPSDDDLIGTIVEKEGKKRTVTAEFLLVDGTLIKVVTKIYYMGEVGLHHARNTLLEQFWEAKKSMRNEILIKLDKEYEKWAK